MTAVFKHELRMYFRFLTAYVFGAFLLAFTGIGAMLYNIQAAVSNFEFVLNFCSLVFVVIVGMFFVGNLVLYKRAGRYICRLFLYHLSVAALSSNCYNP